MFSVSIALGEINMQGSAIKEFYLIYMKMDHLRYCTLNETKPGRKTDLDTAGETMKTTRRLPSFVTDGIIIGQANVVDTEFIEYKSALKHTTHRHLLP